MNDHSSKRGSRRDGETEQRRARHYDPIHADEVEHTAQELTLIAVALREGLVTVARQEQWCLALSSIRLAHRLAIGSLSPGVPVLRHAPLNLRPPE